MLSSANHNDIEVVHLPVIPLKLTPRGSNASATNSKTNSHRDSESFASCNIGEPPASSSQDSFPFSVPPSTPSPSFTFNHSIESIKHPFPKLSDLKLPYIREVGIKSAIDILSDYFSCQDYKLNPLKFWFLDVITDCLWKLQDEFQFPERYQKIIVEWVLHVFDLIRDPQRNLSRREFFQIFNEALMIADEQVQAGCDMLPTPGDLFTLVQEEEEEERISFPSQSEQLSSISLTAGGESYIAIGIDESTEVFKMPKAPEKCYKYDTSTDTNTSEAQLAGSLCGCEESMEFYQPNHNTPDRFRSCSSTTVSSMESDDLPVSAETKFLWKRSSRSSHNVKKVCIDDKFVNLDDIISKQSEEVETEEKSHDDIVDEWKDYMDQRKELIQDIEMKILVNSCALDAIKQFVYDYFDTSFQYTIVKLALMNSFHSITQSVNTEWRIPKILKEELKKPKIEKTKQKKEKKKEKKEKKKPGKKTQQKKKQKKEKKAKKPKKEKKPKKKTLTKEEKAELARLKHEQEMLEEERRKAEENRRMLFPLNDAASDEFFKSIFDHWVRPKITENKGKRKNTAKKGKK